MPLVSFINQLMRACNELEAVDMVKFGGHLITEKPSRTSGTYGPCLHFFRVAPDQVAEGAFVRDFLRACDDADLVKSSNLRT